MSESRRPNDRSHCVVTVRVPSDDGAVSSALEAIAASDEDLTVHDVRVDEGTAVDFDVRELTEKQRETIVRAVEIGYYATPRRGSLDDLCAEFDRSKSAISQRLRNAESTIVRRIVEELTAGEASGRAATSNDRASSERGSNERTASSDANP